MSFGVQKENPTVVRNNKPITVLSAVRKGYEGLFALCNFFFGLHTWQAILTSKTRGNFRTASKMVGQRIAYIVHLSCKQKQKKYCTDRKGLGTFSLDLSYEDSGFT